MTGRGLMLGALRAASVDPSSVFTGEGHAPAPLTEADGPMRAPESGAEALDMPDWLWSRFEAGFGEKTSAIVEALRHRAPVHLRVNLRKATRAEAMAALQRDGIETDPHAAAETALDVRSGARKVKLSPVYLDGRVELQDAASQALVAALPLQDGLSVLDYCAGGGGKSLAIAGRMTGEIVAHDSDPGRMRDLPERARRAGVEIAQVPTAALGGLYDLYDIVLCDVPCSGSGAWRRAPDGKWALTPERLAELTCIQAEILDAARHYVRPGGILAYATCSLLQDENHAQIVAFLARHPGWHVGVAQSWTPDQGTDGFYTAQLTHL